MSESTQEELLRLARSGDHESLGRVFHHYRDQLRHYAQEFLDRRLNARVDGSDVIQESMLEAVRDFPAFRGNTEGELLAWLKKIARHNAHEMYQKHDQAARRSVRREQRLESGSDSGRSLMNNLPGSSNGPAEEAAAAERSSMLRTALSGLIPEDRELLRLRYEEGLSLRKLSEHLNCSERVAAALVAQAVRSVRRGMEPPLC